MKIRIAKKDIKKHFIQDCYNNNRSEYLKARKKDYLKVQFEFTCYIDNLLKEGLITRRAFNGITF